LPNLIKYVTKILKLDNFYVKIDYNFGNNLDFEILNMKKLKLDELKRVSVKEFKKQKKLPLVLILDNIRSLNNIGSIFRTADAFSIKNLYLCGITGTPPHKEIHKTALGATESVSWKYFENTCDAIKHLKTEGYKIYGIEQADEAVMLNMYKPSQRKPIAFVFGNEVVGVDDKILDFLDGVIEIPQYGTKHSLNVAVSVGIVVWDYVSKTKKGL